MYKVGVGLVVAYLRIMRFNTCFFFASCHLYDVQTAQFLSICIAPSFQYNLTTEDMLSYVSHGMHMDMNFLLKSHFYVVLCVSQTKKENPGVLSSLGFDL